MKVNFTENDFRPTNRIFLTYSKDEYFVTESYRIVNLRTGKDTTNLSTQINEIEKVFNAKGEQIALKTIKGLKHFNADEHDPTILAIKRINYLLTFSELGNNLLESNINHSNLFTLPYGQKVTARLKSPQGAFNCNCWVAEIKGTQYDEKTRQTTKLTIKIKRYLVDKKRKVFLYSIDTTFALW